MMRLAVVLALLALALAVGALFVVGSSALHRPASFDEPARGAGASSTSAALEDEVRDANAAEFAERSRLPVGSDLESAAADLEPEAGPRLRVRLFYDDGAIVSDTEVTYLVEGRRRITVERNPDGGPPIWTPPYRMGGTLRTDAAGLAVIELDAAARKAERSSLTLSLGYRAEGGTPLPPELHGEHDLGDVVLHRFPLLVAGHVVGSDDQPVAGAEIVFEEAMRRRIAQPSGARRSGPDGVFALHTNVEFDGPVRVRAKRGSMRSPLVEVSAGTANLLLRLERTGSITGRILHPSGSSPANLIVRALPLDNAIQVPLEAELERAGEFRLAPLETGSYRVEVVEATAAEPIFIVPSVRVHEGEATRPPLLDPLDLRSLLRSIEVQVTAEDRLVVPAKLSYRRAGETDAEWQQVQVTGRAELLSDADALDLRVEAHGYDSVELFRVSADTKVTLQPGHELLVYLWHEEHEPCSYEVVALKEDVDGVEHELESRKMSAPEAGTSLHHRAPKGKVPRRAWLTVNQHGAVKLRITKRCQGNTASIQIAILNGDGDEAVDALMNGETRVTTTEDVIMVVDTKAVQEFLVEAPR